jgi:hypothetical protein
LQRGGKLEDRRTFIADGEDTHHAGLIPRTNTRAHLTPNFPCCVGKYREYVANRPLKSSCTPLAVAVFRRFRRRFPYFP